MKDACFFSILVLYIAASEGLLYKYINESKTWKTARTYCKDHNATLASGNPENFTSKVPNGDSVFIGTIQVKERLWMAGCYDQAKAGVIINILRGKGVTTDGTTLFSRCLLECYHHKYIAVYSKREFECYCLNSTDGLRRLPQSHCKRISPGIGYSGSNQRLAVYEIDQGETKVEESTKRLSNSVCGSLLLEKKEPPLYRERDCHDRLYVLYQKLAGPNISYSNEISNLTWKETFKQATKDESLVEKKLLQIDALRVKLQNMGSNEIWIGMFQETAKITDIESFGDIRAHSCGLLKSSGITFVQCDGLKAHFICQSDHQLEISHKVRVSTEGNVKVSVSTEGNVKVSVSTEGNSEKLPSGNVLELVVICTVIGVSLIVGIVTGVCCYLKRRKSRSGNVEKVCTNNEYAVVNTLHQNPKPDNSLTRQTCTTATDNGEYDLFDRKGDIRYRPGPQEDLYDHTRPLPAENNYDHLSNVKSIIRADVEDTYDHTQNVRNMKADTEDAYDHTSNVSKIKADTEDTYDHVSNVKNTKADMEDTYDHTASADRN